MLIYCRFTARFLATAKELQSTRNLYYSQGEEGAEVEAQKEQTVGSCNESLLITDNKSLLLAGRGGCRGRGPEETDDVTSQGIPSVAGRACAALEAQVRVN